MKRHESKYNPAVKELSDFVIKQARDSGIRPDMITKITRVLDGVERMDEMISQKEQLLVQKEKELVRLKSITDNSSKVARDIISESKQSLDKAISLHKSGNFSEALKYSDIALYNIGDINSFEVKGVEQANKLYLERKQQHVEATAKRDYLYNSSVVNGVNAFSWVKSNPTRDFYTFFREALNIPDREQKSPDNVRIIKKLYELLPLYVEEAQRTNYFYNEYNKYYDVLLKLQQVVSIHDIRAASSKGLKDYEEALKSCDIALKIDPKNLTISNLKNAILQEKQVIEANKLKESNLLVSQTKEIEKLKELLARKEVETQEKSKLLIQKGNELTSKEKVSIDQHKKETETLKALLAQKELENKELLARKDKEVKELEKVKNELLKKELLDILPQAYPGSGYNKPFKEWDTSWWGKKVIDAGNFEEIERYLPKLREKAAKFKEENLKKQAKELENATLLQEENIKKEQEIAKFKELLSIKEFETEELLARRDKEVKELEKVNNDVLIKEFIEILPQRYPDLYPKNFAEWPHDIWGKQVVDGNDIEAIKHYLPIYRKEVIENLNQLILTERAKIEELLIEKANVQQKLIDKDNLLSDQTEDIERINVLLETKGIIIQRLEQEKEILQTRHDILDMKMQLTVKEFTVREREKDKALREKDNEIKKLTESSKLLAGYKEEMLKFQKLCETKEAEIKEKEELLVQKEIEKAELVDDLQGKLHFKDSEILGLQMMVNDMNLAGDYQLEHLND
jgi:hypothetical protein